MSSNKLDVPKQVLKSKINGPFTKAEVIAVMKELGRYMDTSKMTVGFGGAMLLKGLRDQTSDIDLDIPHNQKFRDRIGFIGGEYIEEMVDNGKRKIRIIRLGDLDFHLDTLDYLPGEIVKSEYGDFNVTSLECIRRFKSQWGREKDLLDVKKIDEYLNSQK